VNVDGPQLIESIVSVNCGCCGCWVGEVVVVVAV
jgi:hypothetical protein